jgi:hypothetical protein
MSADLERLCFNLDAFAYWDWAYKLAHSFDADCKGWTEYYENFLTEGR